MKISTLKLHALLIAGENAATEYNRCGEGLKAYGLCCAALLLFSFAALADVVNVYEETECGGESVRVAERALETGQRYETGAAPVKSGWIFTHWTISTTQDFDDRDEWGRALDVAPFDLYESTTLTAHYLPVAQDSDGDGVADGSEIYWYGDLSQSATSDTDDDGITFAEELARGTNPIMAESGDAGPVACVAGKEWLFNPNNYGEITIRSEPEGALFPTTSEVYRPGARVATSATGVYDPETTTFAYWSFNGERLADEWGRAESGKAVVTDGSPLTIVAYAVSDYETRMKLYWYGTTEVEMTSDTDEDGVSFAEELVRGTNPLMAETKDEGPVRTADGELWQYNPYDYQPYTIKSEPEGALFPNESYYVRAGTKVVVSAPGSDFYGWQVNGGEIRRDEWGRSEDAFTFTMPSEAMTLVAKTEGDYETRMKLYWYGTTEVEMTSDTDDDGVSFADELARGTNPLMAETKDEGPVKYVDTQTQEFNLQPFEQVFGTVIDEKYEVFPTFEGAATPTVADVNGDGMLDIVVEVAGGETVVYLGCGGAGNPEFRKVAWDASWAAALAAARPEPLEGLAFDVPPPADALSWSFGDADGDGVKDLLISDAEGRIWYYKNEGGSSSTSGETPLPRFVLQHKVWGGSFAGFANGLCLAAVDWDEDGDLDCLCGTAEGKLVLLRDPKVGRPTNLKALVGVDNVMLQWDPSPQSRIRGYRVYRADEVKVEGEGEHCNLLAYPSLPTYRDYPEEIADYDYKVSSVSRHYVAGNSTPIESESPATEAVRAMLGKVKFFWNDVVVKQGERAEVMLSIENSLNYDVAGKTQIVTYDPAYLTPLKIVKTGLTENVSYEESVADGKWTITLKSGELAAGGGKFLTFVFDTLKVGTTKVGEATVTIAARQEPAPYRLGDMSGDGIVDKDDLRELAKLKNAASHKCTADQLKAGDLNGNGVLDNADYQALRDLLKGRGLL